MGAAISSTFSFTSLFSITRAYELVDWISPVLAGEAAPDTSTVIDCCCFLTSAQTWF